MKEDTSPETPVAKGNSDPPEALPPGTWKPPGAASAEGAPFGPHVNGVNGAELGWALGSGRVRTFQAKGAGGIVLALVVLFVVGAIFALIMLFALGVGTAVALGAGLAAALGMGAGRLRRRLSSAHHPELGASHGER